MSCLKIYYFRINIIQVVKIKNGLTKALGIYFLLGGIICLISFLFERGVVNLFYTLLPSLLIVVVLLLFIYTGYIALVKTEHRYTQKFLNLALAIQTIQISLFGFVFKNYFGPYIGIGFTDTPSIEFLFSFRFYTYLLSNGYNRVSSEISVMLNLIPLSFFIILNIL